MTTRRLASIDMLRGLVMVVMALDHVRDMLTPPHSASLDFAQAGAPLFFTRWITHLCAPTFVLLAGTSAYLYRTQHNTHARAHGAHAESAREVSWFLVTRGAWLIIVELTIVSFAWNFNLGPRFVPILQVIWAIGISMIALAGLVWLPRSAIAAVGVAMIVGHNLLDAVQPAADVASPAWILLHLQGQLSIGAMPVAYVGYPVIPWVGVMAVGYAIGPVFVDDDPGRSRRLVGAGLLLTLAFTALRAANLYGEPDAWRIQDTLTATLVDFLDTTKYPPSLQYLLMTLGPALVLLGALERAHGRTAGALAVIGRVPFFFYVAHLYVIHLVALALGLVQGFAIHEIAVVFVYYPPGYGVSLAGVYAFWIAIVAALYPACRWFAGVKARRPDWWLSYV